MRFLTAEERDQLDAANLRAWQESKTLWSRTPGVSLFRKRALFGHDPEAYRVAAPFAGRVVDRIMNEVKAEQRYARLWFRHHPKVA